MVIVIRETFLGQNCIICIKGIFVMISYHNLTWKHQDSDWHNVKSKVIFVDLHISFIRLSKVWDGEGIPTQKEQGTDSCPAA